MTTEQTDAQIASALGAVAAREGVTDVFFLACGGSYAHMLPNQYIVEREAKGIIGNALNADAIRHRDRQPDIHEPHLGNRRARERKSSYTVMRPERAMCGAASLSVIPSRLESHRLSTLTCVDSEHNSVQAQQPATTRFDVAMRELPPMRIPLTSHK